MHAELRKIMGFARTMVCISLAAVMLLVTGTGLAGEVSINVPDGSFEQATVGDAYTAGTSGAYPNLAIEMGGYTENPGNFSIQSTVTSQGVTSPGPGPAAQDGSNFLSMWPGETPYLDNSNGISTVLTRTFSVSTTGITDQVVAGRTYTATVAVALPGFSWSTAKPPSYFNMSTTPSPAYSISILAGGSASPVATQTIPADTITAANAWQDLSTTWTAPAGFNGDSLQVLVEIFDFIQGPYHMYSDQGAIDNIQLSYATSTSGSAAPYTWSNSGTVWSSSANWGGPRRALPMSAFST